MQSLRYRSWWIVGGLAMVLAIIVTSLLPSSSLPSVQVWDKFEHAVAYFVLAAWFGGIVRPDRYRRLALALLALGIAVEVSQQAMGLGRTADLRDVLANAIGIVLGLAIAVLGVSGWMRGVERMLGVAVPSPE
jgi:VanZ family protein